MHHLPLEVLGLDLGQEADPPEVDAERRHARSNFLGYHGFTGSICVSVNDEVVHGIPGDRVIAPGDVVSVDGGEPLAVAVGGWEAPFGIVLVVDRLAAAA